ncbi:Piwi domain-containing protein [Parapedobacter sp. GCM10030251]|uniref:argonaute/piwi family protein n=1 Tax=Parapedobacter sp. GCM10030251 TaxID=3273419 RepID=UPI00360F1200
MPLLLNTAPIIFDDVVIDLEKFPFNDERLEQLRNDCRYTHMIKRTGDSILAVPLKKGLPPLGGIREQVDLKKDLSLTRSLANHAFYRELFKRNLWVSSITPLSYLITKKNLLEDCMPQGYSLAKGLGVFVKWEVEFRVIDPLEKAPFVSITINISTSTRISLTCQQLMTKGVSILNQYVGKPYYGRNPELKPRFSTVGRVVNVNTDGMLELEDLRPGELELADPTEMYLEPREDHLDNCIRVIYGSDASQILSNIDTKLAQYHVGNKKFEKLQRGLASYQTFKLSLVDGVPFQIGNFLDNDKAKTNHIKTYKAEKPIFVFSPGAAKVSTWNDGGLQQYGPYSRETFSPNKPRICVVLQANKKGQVEQILHKFLNGMPPVAYGKGRKTFEFTGLKNKFRLQDCYIDFFTAEDDSITSYNRAITAALQSNGSTRTFDLALIQIDDGFRSRVASNNPYLAAKARFVGQQIPVQEFTMENLGQPDARIVWSLNNMALATYAKLGGVPWLLTADSTIGHEVVFGIGSAMIHTSRLSAKERMVGITTVFTGDGRYYVNNISSAVTADEYFETLLQNLRTTMDRVKTDFAWRPKDTVRLIFHAFKTFKDAEADAVKQVMSELGDFNVEFAFVHVAPNSPYILFDTAQPGSFGKGIYAPERTNYLQLSEHVALASLTGAVELKKTSDGIPQPVQLILHRDSTFKDMAYLSKQVIKFGAHSWRSYQPAPMPVSIYYSQLMAQMLSQLSGTPNWNPDAIYNKIGTTRWFL